MLDGLGHKAFVGGHHQHGQVDAAGAGQHILDKLLMTGHIHDTGLGTVRKIQMGKAQLDGDAPLFLLLEPVGVDAGERLDQQGLAVIHMTGGADDHMFHLPSTSFTAPRIKSKSSSHRVRRSSR